jgi:hypothetical protein
LSRNSDRSVEGRFSRPALFDNPVGIEIDRGRVCRVRAANRFDIGYPISGRLIKALGKPRRRSACATTLENPPRLRDDTAQRTRFDADQLSSFRSECIMRRGQWMTAAMLIGLGYVLGSLDGLKLPRLFAQQEPAAASEEAAKKIQAAYDALRSAMDSLKQESLYNPATKGLNSYAILAGGVDAVKDLDDGKGVDPETFAALYAGDAIDSVAESLSYDDEGRLTYKNKPVRIYPISRLKKVYAQRQELTGEVVSGSKKN